MRKIASIFLAASLAAAMVTACGGDDTATPGPDSGRDVTNSDGQPPPPGDGGGMDGNMKTDGGDGGCDFAAFVRGLIQTHTNMTDQPSVDLGQNCTDKQDQAQFKSLFP